MKEIKAVVKFVSGVEMDFIFLQDDAGHWIVDSPLHQHDKMLQSDVLDLLRMSPDWKEIRRNYFPMEGFAS